MRFLIDAQLPPALAIWLMDRRYDAVHVADSLGPSASDESIWSAARLEDRVLITKDRDFALWIVARREGPRVIWLRLGNATRRRLVDWLEVRWSEIELALAGDARLIEVR